MRIETYFRVLNDLIAARPFVHFSNLTFEKRSSHIGFIKGEVRFSDGSILHMREYVDTEGDVERLMYVYHYQDGNGNLVFRYDNSGHHRGLSTYPHHKHVGNRGEVQPAQPASLGKILQEIGKRLSANLL
ncbi:MAG TPA: hypothetical protein ENJ02_11775 [Chloroflexi bacterium]|nr:hypothetical protein [Chloroflexota bacterium]